MAEYGQSANEPGTKGKEPKNLSNLGNSSFLFNQLQGNKKSKRIKVSQADKLIFFRQLSVILLSGLPLAQGLELLAENMTNKKFSRCILDISSDLSSGQDLSSSLKTFPKIFDPITIGLIEAGETGGILSKVLERIALLQEAKSKLKGQIIGALVYPVIVLVLALTVSLALLIFIVPTFQELFNGLGAELPGLTVFLLNLSKFVTQPLFFLILPLTIFSLVIIFRYIYSTVWGRLIIDQLTLKIPLFGSLISRSEMAGLSDTLGTLLNSGITIVDALERCVTASGNQLVKNAIKKSIFMIKQGQTLSYSLSVSKVMPNLFISMIKIGEETGALPFMLDNLSSFYKREVDEVVSALTKAMEPAVIFVVAGIVGTIVIALYLPMFSLLEQI